ncbi:hypothetical protein [Hymenobacter yonginensis]|uniref:Lipoprotein n=1 Tax=Hymenobacter yonginensis TaxID=748197 RepID=A0ABY7PTJ0_9BACT|nr:hypothetical protein [Hymenobacter yonginensis]WBO86236.1 hypothetical protein O9Z63_08235 [Hymenobacter yonginensis]
MLKLFSYPLLFLALFTSCQKETDGMQPEAPVANPLSAFLRVAQSSPAADEYISGEFDGIPLNCATDKWPSVSSTFYINNAQSSESGQLIRQNPNADVQVNISFVNTGIFQKAMPASWPYANHAVCEAITVSIWSLGPNNEPLSLFKGGTGYGKPLKVEITSTANGMVEGTFSGRLYQVVDGQSLMKFFLVKNGKFRIQTRTVFI